ncbi:hypothetical protein HZA97_07030 [Candidatus Woesearchaeota archaeon]|nr:hypothetical protein [Candidatus Woesearchaeota archaeon]
MDFKKGDNIVIGRNLGLANNKSSNKHYYYGGTIGDLPLESKGKVVSVDSQNNFILVNFPDLNNLNWRVHPDEILLQREKQDKSSKLEIQDLKSLARHPIFELAEQSPVFVINEKVYTVSEGVVESDFFKDKKNKKPLVEIGDINSFDELYFSREQTTIEKIGLEYASEITKKLTSLKLDDDVLDVPQLIYKQVFPYFKGEEHKNKLIGILGAELSKTHEEKKPAQSSQNLRNSPELERIIRNVQAEVGNIKSGVEKEGAVAPKRRNSSQKKLDNLFGYQHRKEYLGNSLLGKAIDGRDVILTKGKIHELILGSDVDCTISLSGKGYSIHTKISSVSEIEKKYFASLDKRIKLSSLKDNFSKEKILELLDKKSRDLLAMKGKTEFKGDGFGFTTHDSHHYVYIEVPEFAIKSQFDDNYYFFEKTRIGFWVYSGNGKSLSYSDGFFMIDNNNHPFNHNVEGSFVRICTGNQSFSTSGKDAGEVIAKRLRRCKEVLMYGYTSNSYDSRYKLSSISGNYSSHIRKKSDLEKKGVLIIQGGSRR